MYTPANPSFAKQKCGQQGHTFHGHVSMMNIVTLKSKATNLYEISQIPSIIDRIVICLFFTKFLFLCLY